MVSRHSLFLCLLLALVTPFVVAQKSGSSVQTGTVDGISTTTFESPKGRVKVFLPDEMAAPAIRFQAQLGQSPAARTKKKSSATRTN
jgi:hypothetical protein